MIPQVATSATQKLLDSYDAVPYPNMTHHATNPLRTAALAQMMGMEPAPPDRCRVLDIGCATGANILAMAALNPQSSYVGVDLSQLQIGQGKAIAAELGITNTSLHAIDLTQIDESLGSFDYIIAHGLYSWVPVPVRDALMRVCRERLAPNGVAYISYNCFPGWHTFQAYREMFLYRTAHLTDPWARIEAVKQFLSFLQAAWPVDKNYHGTFLHGIVAQLERDADLLGDQRDSYIFHEYLEEVNDPLYVHEFLAHADAHGLQYLCDADIHLDFPNGFEPGVADTIGNMSSNLEDYQQYMDVVRMRAFRRTLLCHKEQTINRALRVERLRGIYMGTGLRAPSDAPPSYSEDRVTFDAGDGITFTTNHPLTKAALSISRARYPQTFTVEEFVREAASLLKESNPQQSPVTAQDAAELGANLLRMVTSYSAMLEIWALPAPWAIEPGERPRLSTWAQYELRSSPFVTNLRHERLRLDPMEVAIARLLDGTRTASDISLALEPALRDGRILLHGETANSGDAQAPPAPFDEALALLPAAVAERLRLLTVYGLVERDKLL